MLTKLKNSNKEKGFTIIEVMIVLAIAGLIILIVFLAVPALQRNGRNTATKNDAGNVSGAIAEFKSNNDGSAPTAISAAGVVSGAGGTISATAKVGNGTTIATAATATAAAPVAVEFGKDCAAVVNPRATAVRYWTEQASGGNGTKCIDS